MKKNVILMSGILFLGFALLPGNIVTAADDDVLVSKAPTREELRQQQASELEELRAKYDRRARNEVPRNKDGSLKTDSKQYEKILNEYKNKNTEIKDRYKAQDPIASDFDPKNQIEGVKSTGSKPKDVRADGDWTADTPEAAKKKVDEWKKRGDTVIDDGYKKRNITTDEVLWEPGRANDPKKVSDPDAYSTSGGKEKTGAGGVKDPKGVVLDNEKKYLDGKERGNLKDQAKSVSKAGDASGRANAPDKATQDLYEKAKNLKNYGDDVTAGISDLGDTPAVRDQKLKDFQAKMDAEMTAAKAAATKTSDAKQQVREDLSNSAKKAEGTTDWDKARNKANYGDTPTTSEAIADRHKQVKDSNKAAEDFNDSLKKKGKGPDGTPDNAKTGQGGPDSPDAKNSNTAKPEGPETGKGGKSGSVETPESGAKAGGADAPDAKTGKGSGTDIADPKGAKTTGSDLPDSGKTSKGGKSKGVEVPDAPKVGVDGPEAPGTKGGPGADAPDAKNSSTAKPEGPETGKGGKSGSVETPEAGAKAGGADAPDAKTGKGSGTDIAEPKGVKTTEPELSGSGKTGKGAGFDAPDAPKVGVDGPDVPGTKGGPRVDAPDGPKVNVDAPDAPGSKVSAGSGVKGKVIKGVGAGMDAVDIFGTAEDVKTDIQKGDYKGAATKTGEAIANQVTAGAYGTVKGTAEKLGDKSAAESDIDKANKTNEEAYRTQVENKLRKAGMTKAEAKDLMDKGGVTAGEGKLKDMKVPLPEKVVEKGPEADDTAGERAKAVAQGIADNTKKAGKFLNDTRKDLTEIGTGLTEKGVAEEVAGQTKENIKGWFETFQEGNKAEKTMAEGKQAMVDRLIAKGATPEGAQKAADGMYDKGDTSGYKKLNELLDKKNHKLADKEAKSDSAGEKEKGDKTNEKSSGLLDQVASKKDSRNKDKTEAGMEGMQETSNGEKASTSGDKDTREAKSTVNKAGAEAGETRDQSTRDKAQAEKENSLGKKLGDAIEDSVKKGGEAFGGSVGKAGADKANEKIYQGDKKDKEKESADTMKKGGETSKDKPESKEPSKPGGQSDDKGQPVPPAGDGTTQPPADTGTAQAPGANPPATAGTTPAGNANTGSTSKTCPRCGHYTEVFAQTGRCEWCARSDERVSQGLPPLPNADTATPTVRTPPKPEYEIVTCPGCSRKLKTAPGTGIECPYCVTMDCPVCGFKKCYDRGSEPASCPACAARRAAAAAAAAAASKSDGEGSGGEE